MQTAVYKIIDMYRPRLFGPAERQFKKCVLFISWWYKKSDEFSSGSSVDQSSEESLWNDISVNASNEAIVVDISFHPVIFLRSVMKDDE